MKAVIRVKGKKLDFPDDNGMREYRHPRIQMLNIPQCNSVSNTLAQIRDSFPVLFVDPRICIISDQRGRFQAGGVVLEGAHYLFK